MSAFVDNCNLHVTGGDGGAGCVSFRREAHVSRGGPDGGDGGKGGDVWLIADRNEASLLSFRDHPHRSAKSGTHGKGKKQHGRTGLDREIRVPVGTVVLDHNSDNVIADLVNDGDRWLAAEGGRGGRGNAKFLSNKQRAPGFAEQGEVGEARWLTLELKLMADVALVGFPNAGKSTLISVISAAKPKIADYPFTTLVPNLGVVRVDDNEFVVADVPGLIEGASDGRGLGHQFLRHIERARVLVILVDLAVMSERTPAQQIEVLLHELEAYRPDLAERPRIIVGSRADLADTDVEFDGLRLVSVTRQGVNELTGLMSDAVRAARSELPAAEGFAVHRPVPEGIRVESVGDREWEVHGRDAHRAVALSDLTNLDALAYAQARLKKLGVDRALVRAGVRIGDTIHIGALSFEFEDDDVVWETRNPGSRRMPGS